MNMFHGFAHFISECHRLPTLSLVTVATAFFNISAGATDSNGSSADPGTCTMFSSAGSIFEKLLKTGGPQGTFARSFEIHGGNKANPTCAFILYTPPKAISKKKLVRVSVWARAGLGVASLGIALKDGTKSKDNIISYENNAINNEWLEVAATGYLKDDILAGNANIIVWFGSKDQAIEIGPAEIKIIK